MTQPATPPSNRSGALDLLRFFAVIAVFFGHYTDTFNYVYHIVPANLKYTLVSRYASLALFVFFMVSGYVVTMTSVKRNIKEFLITRLSRIYPLFWVSCVVAFLLPRLIREHTYLAYASFKTFLFNLTMVPIAFGYPLINPVAHTLITELVFYFFVACIILFKLWNKILTVLSIILSLFVADILFFHARVYIVLIPFIAGMLFYLIRANYDKQWKSYALLIISFICSLRGAKDLADQLDIFYKVPGSHNATVIMFIIILIYVTFLLITLKKINIPGRPIFTLMGEIAYPFYLFHIYFLFVYWYFSDTIQADILLFSILFVTIVISWILNVWVEKPFSSLVTTILVTITNFFRRKNVILQKEISK